MAQRDLGWACLPTERRICSSSRAARAARAKHKSKSARCLLRPDTRGQPAPYLIDMMKRFDCPFPMRSAPVARYKERHDTGKTDSKRKSPRLFEVTSFRTLY